MSEMAYRPPVYTVNGHDLAEVVSAFQKAIRRCALDDALYWAADMYLSGYVEYAWKRMRIIVSEDIGPANPTLPAVIHALYETWDGLRKKGDRQPHEKLPFVHAVFLMATSKKSRVIDHAGICHFRDHGHRFREVPDYALDKHTSRGRRLGRGFEHFFKEAGLLVNEVEGLDVYRDEAAKILIEGTALESRPRQDTRFAGKAVSAGSDESVFEDDRPDRDPETNGSLFG